jgi:molybdenum cofactor cytidylyltransferase
MGLTLGRALRLIPRDALHKPAIDRPSASIAFVGAGGKTTSLFSLARELGRPTLVTTTTHLGSWQAQWADRHVVARSVADLTDIDDSAVTLVTGPAESDARLSALKEPVFRALHEFAQAKNSDLLIEADGARQRSLKAPGPLEPQVPPFVTTVVVVAGLHGIGARLDEVNIHRPEIFASLSGLKAGAAVAADAVVKVLLHLHGGLQGIPPGARRIALLNQADSDELQAQAQRMARNLQGPYDAIVVANMQDGRVHAVHEACAGIVLAAGAATRFGSPKQLAVWREEPLVRVAARTAVEARLAPVLVVTGAYSAQVRHAITGLAVQAVENNTWQEGQGSSVRTGVASLPAASAAAVFLLADQPLVNAALVQALVEAHSREDAAIVAPLIQDNQRGNPVLFDRETFDRLLTLKGDVGGRSIFSEYRVHYITWHDAVVGLDIDTPDDYADLLEADP